MDRSRIQIAKADIVKHFDGLPQHVLKLKDIRAVLASQRAFWRLAQNTTAEHFIAFLKKHAKLREIEFLFPQRPESCYVWGDVPLLTILLSLRKDLYFSHYTAMRLHGLTEQSPTTTYVTDERITHDQRQRAKLEQSDIDRAFSQAPRVSQNYVEHAGKKIYLLNGSNTGHLGVVAERVNDEDGREVLARLTNLERTLIDITVRPVYAGGVFEVAKAFALAKDRVSINRLVAMLRKLDFAYPYHQAIGYYLERADYKPNQIDLVRRLPVEHDFYLTHQMGETRHVQPWRLFVPDGF
ncbi:type IV toxin-antitoxin system AbiEi family antitoxin domain-containing protein [Paraburkholderia sp. GAS334]|uniref:type IV toxin-antitoxin system AbiEi family antitoxin domain-containing protein n=1 Tax=Paraburkholderia sp. GAS334 TaxID=3035131 RepID=UPI003D197532